MNGGSGPEVFSDPYESKRDAVGTVFVTLRGISVRRGLEIAAYRSRAVSAGQIYEFMTTDEPATLRSVVDRDSGRIQRHTHAEPSENLPSF